MPAKNRRLRIMAGPNGSGKSTILKEVRQNFYSGPFVNADEIEKLLSETNKLDLAVYQLAVPDVLFADFINEQAKSWSEKALKENSSVTISCKENHLIVEGSPSAYDAALAADFIRRQLLLKQETFTFETVLSHPSKIEFLKQSIELGFKNYLYFICTVDPVINIERIAQRVQLGGHAVPKEKIQNRYFQSLVLLSSVIPLCHRVFLFDNSSEQRSIDPVAEINENKELIIRTDELPWWVQEFVVNTLYHK